MDEQQNPVEFDELDALLEGTEDESARMAAELEAIRQDVLPLLKAVAAAVLPLVKTLHAGGGARTPRPFDAATMKALAQQLWAAGTASIGSNDKDGRFGTMFQEGFAVARRDVTDAIKADMLAKQHAREAAATKAEKVAKDHSKRSSAPANGAGPSNARA